MGGGGGGMMVKDVTKFHKCSLESRGVLECVCVQGFIQGFVFWEGETPKFGVAWWGWGVYSAQKLGGSGDMSPSPQIKKKNRCSEIGSGGTSSQF